MLLHIDYYVPGAALCIGNMQTHRDIVYDVQTDVQHHQVADLRMYSIVDV